MDSDCASEEVDEKEERAFEEVDEKEEHAFEEEAWMGELDSLEKS